MEQWWNDADGGKTKVLGEKIAAVPLCPPEIPHEFTECFREFARRMHNEQVSGVNNITQ
jgi:hypothetical protein